MKSALCIAILTASATLAGCHAAPARAGRVTASTVASQTRTPRASHERPVTADMLADRLRAGDEENVDEMAAALVGGIRADARRLVLASTRGNEPASGQATETLSDFDELAILTLLEVPEHDDADDTEWRMRMAAYSETHLRRKVIARLDSMLADRASTPARERVCDTAYTLLGQVVHWGPGNVIEPPARFLTRPEAARDLYITRARQSETWRHVLMAVVLVDFAGPGGSGASAPLEDPVDASSLLDEFTRPDDGSTGRPSAALAASERRAARAAVDIYLAADPDTSRKAQRLLTDLQDLAILALIEREAPNPVARQWMLRTAVEAEGALRRTVLAGLESLLEDTRPLANSIPRGAEGVPPRRRLCDAAYLEIHRVVHFGESLDAERASADRLLFATDDERDAIILAARTSKTW
jgi:hypothetical protein